MDASYEDLEAEIARLQERVIFLEREVAFLTEEKDALKQERSDLMYAVTRLQEDLNNLEMKAEALLTEVRELYESQAFEDVVNAIYERRVRDG